MNYFGELENGIRFNPKESVNLGEDLFEYYGAHDLEPRRDDVFNKLYFINQNTLKGKVTNETGRLMNASTAYVKKLECSFCQRVFHKEFSLALHERKSHNRKQKREFSRLSLVRDVNQGSNSRNSRGLKKHSKSNDSDEEEEEDSSGDEATSEDEPKYADTTTDEEGNDGDSDIEIVASKGYKESKKPQTLPTRQQRYQTRSRNKNEASITNNDTIKMIQPKRECISPIDDDQSDSGISESSPSPAKSRKISEQDIKKIISEEKEISSEEESPTKNKAIQHAKVHLKVNSLEEELMRNGISISRVESEDDNNKSKPSNDKAEMEIREVCSKEEKKNDEENFALNDTEDDGYDSDYEKMGGSLPLFDPNEECILGL